MDMRSNHRQREIVEQLHRSGGSMRIHALARALSVTEETVRRNLRSLADGGVVERMHGGVRLVGPGSTAEPDFQARFRENPAAKRRIARHVAAMLPDEASLFLDIGSTTAHIADALRDHRRLVVVTNSVYVAFRLASRNENRVFMAGGELRALSAIDLALWDILGQACGQPVYRLLGGRYHRRIPAYANGWYGGAHTPASKGERQTKPG